MSNKKYTTKADNTGIASAVLCTIHCLMIPALLLIKYLWAGKTAVPNLPYWWGYLDYLFLVISFTAVYHAAGHTTARWIKVSLWTCWCLLSTGILFEEQLHWLAYLASAGLIATHFFNIRLVRKMQRQRV